MYAYTTFVHSSFGILTNSSVMNGRNQFVVSLSIPSETSHSPDNGATFIRDLCELYSEYIPSVVPHLIDMIEMAILTLCVNAYQLTKIQNNTANVTRPIVDFLLHIGSGRTGSDRIGLGEKNTFWSKSQRRPI